MKVVQQGGGSLPLPSPQDEPPYLSFLRAFCTELEELAKQLQLPGKLYWKRIRPRPNLMGCEIWFEEKGSPTKATHYMLLKAPEFFQRDMVKVEEEGAGDYVVMEADPKMVLAYITF